MKMEELIKETENAFAQLQGCIPSYWKLEADASRQTKFIMLVNNWHSPFEACHELVKRIETNEQMLKSICKANGTTLKKICYKAKSKDARALLQTESSKQPLEA